MVWPGWDRLGQVGTGSANRLTFIKCRLRFQDLNLAQLLLIMSLDTCMHALKASSTLRIYVEDVNNNLISRKLEIILGSLIAKIRPAQAKSMKDAAVTDFLVRPSV